MGSGRRTRRLMLLVIACGMPAAVSQSRAEEPIALGADGPEETYSPWPGTRISEARWYLATDALMLMRDSTTNRPFATLGASGDVVLRSGDLEAEFQAGPRVTLGRRLGESHQLEYTWFKLPTWNDQVAVRNQTANGLLGLGNLFSPFTSFGNPAVPFLDYNDLAVIEYRSELQSMEFNLRGEVPMPPGPLAVSVLVGLRYMNIRERFGYRTESHTPAGAASSNDVLVDTGNDLWGLQIGALLEWQVAYRSWITLDLKGGICNNAADQGTIYTHQDPLFGQNTYTGARAEDVTAWLGEIGLALTCQVTPRLTATFGYQLLWLDGVALGSGNFEANPGILVSGPAGLNHDGHVIYHGPHIGAVLRL